MRLAFDIETDAIDRERVGCPVTKVHCLHVEDVDRGELYGIYDFAKIHRTQAQAEIKTLLLDADDTVVGHNILGFDIPVLEHLYGVQFDRSNCLDTKVLAEMLYPYEVLKKRDHAHRKKSPEFPGNLIGSHSLEAWGWRLGEHKDQKPVSWDEFTPEMLEYCQQDVAVTVKLFKFLEERLGEKAWHV